MKATTLKLFVTMITLATVTITATIPARAQRRSTEKSTETTRSQRGSNTTNTTQQRKTFGDYDKVSRTRVNPNLKSTRSSVSKPQAATTRSSNNQKRSVTTRSSRVQSSPQPSSRTSARSAERYSKATGQQSRISSQRSPSESNRPAVNGRTRNSQTNKSTNRTIDTRKYTSKKPEHSISRSSARRPSGVTPSNSRNFYRIDKTDKRYVPNRNYKGSKKYWSNRYRPATMNYNHNNSKYYSHYNHNNHNHWDRRWEHYRWNATSWHDYYRGYNPRSYVYNRHYYYNYRYGHVIRSFDYRPQVFVHNHHNYYCYNGNFFRFMAGVGYVLVDVPFGLAFEYLPDSYERVHINGFMYFRVGNLFFESADYGFRLVHYPERYYALDDGYSNNGYRFNDDYYYDENY